MLGINHIEMHITHACNLSCESCGHYSNHGHKGVISLKEGSAWLARWSSRIKPKTFTLLGGEPTIHPQLVEFLRLARQHWSESELRIVSNGFFLHRHPELPQLLKEDPKIHLQISIHHASPEFQARYLPVRELLAHWQNEHGIRIKPVDSFGKWTRRYRGFGDSMEPFSHGQPRKSWENCTARTSPQIFDGKIWKCPALAYLGLQAGRYKLSDNWCPYLSYPPLESDCSETELHEFFNREDETWCSMCPAKPELFDLPDPLAMRRQINRRESSS